MPKKPDDDIEKKEVTKGATCGDMDVFEQEIKLKKRLKDELDDYVTKLTSIKGAIEDKIKDYCAERENFEKRKSESMKYHKAKAIVIEGVVKNTKSAIDKEINKYDEKINNILQDIKKWEDKEIPKARMELCETEKDYKTLRYKCTKLNKKIKKYKASNEEKLNKLDELKKDIDLLDETKKGPEIYIKLNEFNRILGEIELKPGDDLIKEFYEVWKNFDNKDKERQEKKQKRKITIEEAKEKVRTCKELKKDRLNEILKSVGRVTLEE